MPASAEDADGHKLLPADRNAVIAQLERCLFRLPGLAGTDQAAVTYRATYDRNGVLLSNPELVGSVADLSSPARRMFADSAYRAFLKCNPLRNLSSEGYEGWHVIEVTFDADGISLVR